MGRGLPGACRWGCAGCRGSSSGLSPTSSFWESRVPRRPEGGAGEQDLPGLSREGDAHPPHSGVTLRGGAGRGGDGEGPAPEACRLDHGTFQVREPRDRPPLLFIDTFAQCVLTALLLDWVWGGLHSLSSLTLWGTPRGPGPLHVLPWTLSLWGSSPKPRGRGMGGVLLPPPPPASRGNLKASVASGAGL